MDALEFVRVKTAVVVSSDALHECASLLSKTVEENKKADENQGYRTYGVAYSGTLIDGAMVDFKSFEELLKYSNRGDRRLVRLKVRTQPNFLPTSIQVDFGGFSTVYEATIQGSEGSVLSAKESCRDIAAHIRVPYGWMYRWATPIVLFVILDAAFFVALSRALELKSSLDGLAASFLAALASVFVCAVLWLARKIAFPRVVFLLGQEKQRNELRQYWRRWAITGIILAVPVGLALRFLGTALKL